MTATPTLAPPINLDWPLMRNNIAREDLDAVIRLLGGSDPILTQSSQVRAFEQEWSNWLGVKYSVFVNSGSSANLITLAALRETAGLGEIIVPPLTWVSDIASVIQNGFTPVFADIDPPRTLGMNTDRILERITLRTKAVFLTHVLGYNALTDRLLAELKNRGISLIEDVCESHGATHAGRKLGSIGLMSNFSFYYGHHMSTIEGGMVCTNDRKLYETLRMMRSHGMVRECSEEFRTPYHQNHPDLNPDFIFAFPAYNVRSTEINAVMGRSQLKRLDVNNLRRSENLALFLGGLDDRRYRTDFDTNGSCNYAFTLILREPDEALRDRIMQRMREHGVEFRRGTAGGGNQLRQPYLRRLLGDEECTKYPCVEHVHFFGFYIGNYPSLEQEKIRRLCAILNEA